MREGAPDPEAEDNVFQFYLLDSYGFGLIDLDFPNR